MRPAPVLVFLSLFGCGDSARSDSSTYSGSYATSSGASATSPSTDAEQEEDTDAAEDTGSPDCDAVAPVVLFASPDDSNSMSAPAQVVDAAAGGLTSAALRTWEFFNYYSFDYPAAEPGDLALGLDLVLETTGDYTFQVGISSATVSDADRAPMNLTFVIDTSGSMSGSPLARVVNVGHASAAKLKAGDIVSMVTWADDQHVLLDGHEVVGPNDPLVLKAFDDLESDGSTNLSAGLEKGYDLANRNHASGRINRLILISDGGANVGVTDADLIAANAGAEDENGIYLVGVGVGEGNTYNDALMDTVTDVGQGASVFVYSEEEANKIFGDRFLQTLGVAARDLQITYELPPGFEVLRFSGEQLSANRDEVQPQHIAPNDAVVLHQTLHTCAPELVTADTEITIRLDWRDADTFEAKQTSVTARFGDLLEEQSLRLAKGQAVFQYVAALKVSRDGGNVAAAKLSALAAIGAALAMNPSDAELDEMIGVLNAVL